MRKRQPKLGGNRMLLLLFMLFYVCFVRVLEGFDVIGLLCYIPPSVLCECVMFVIVLRAGVL